MDSVIRLCSIVVCNETNQEQWQWISLHKLQDSAKMAELLPLHRRRRKTFVPSLAPPADWIPSIVVVSGDDASEEEVAGIVNNQVDSIHRESVSISLSLYRPCVYSVICVKVLKIQELILKHPFNWEPFANA